MTKCSRVEKYWPNKTSNKIEITCIISILLIIAASIAVITVPAYSQTAGPSNPNANVTTAYKLLHQNETSISLSTLPPLTIKTDLPSYNQGDTIVITGHVSQPDSNTAVSLRIMNPSGNLISNAQFLPSSDGSFTKTILATGPNWTDAGTYTIVAQYGTYIHTTTSFYFNGGDGNSTVAKAINSTSQTGNPVSTNPVPTPTPELVQPTTKIPHWVKTVFNLYGQGQVSDDDLISALRFLIQSGVIRVS